MDRKRHIGTDGCQMQIMNFSSPPVQKKEPKTSELQILALNISEEVSKQNQR